MQKLVSVSKLEYPSEIYASMWPKELLKCIEHEKSVFVVVDSIAYDKSPDVRELISILDRNNVQIKKVKTSESLKSISTVEDICSWLVKKNADRTSLLIGVGGGILTDISGFVASIYMRGIRFAHVPTTLLAQVDASIGGKTGVNFLGLKNMLGVIRQPLFTYVCPAFLKSLARRDFFSGAAELLKTFMINNDDGAYGRAVLVLSCISKSKSQDEFEILIKDYELEIAKLVAQAVKVKMDIVSKDQFEQGERRKLNLGHTFAHAIESCAMLDAQSGIIKNSAKSDVIPKVDITHGEAVAMGLVLAASMSEKQGFARQGFREQIESDLRSCGMETDCPFDKLMLLNAMRHDKKSTGDKVNFVLMRSVGDVVVVPAKMR